MKYQYSIEKAKHERKCRSDKCTRAIKKGEKCLVEFKLEEIRVNYRQSPTGCRVVKVKKSYCQHCSKKMIIKIIEDLKNILDHLESLEGELSFISTRTYRGLPIGN